MEKPFLHQRSQPPMILEKQYVVENEYGFRVGEADISLDSVVLPFQRGYSAEMIQLHFPALSLEEVYGAIAFYLANPDAVQKYLDRQQTNWQELTQRLRENPNPEMVRLRAIAASRQSPAA
jgi:hypothetical protein